jgi:hypothetical protein
VALVSMIVFTVRRSEEAVVRRVEVAIVRIIVITVSRTEVAVVRRIVEASIRNTASRCQEDRGSHLSGYL